MGMFFQICKGWGFFCNFCECMNEIKCHVTFVDVVIFLFLMFYTRGFVLFRFIKRLLFIC